MCYPCLRTPVTHVSSLYTEEEKVPDRADEEVVELKLITSSPRPSSPEEERVACRLASSGNTD